MENEKGKLFFILGPNSARKSQTARDVASWIENTTQEIGFPQTACMFSRGTVFRAVAMDLANKQISVDRLTRQDVEEVTQSFSFRRDKQEIIFFDKHGENKEHSLHNGTTATNYAQNPIFQEAVLSYSDQIIQELSLTFDYVIVEGRDVSPEADYALWLTADYQTVRRDIKKHEYPTETQEKSDEDIIKGIRSRDCKDFRKKDHPLRIPYATHIIVRRSFDPQNPNNQEHQKIVQFIGERFLNIANGTERVMGLINLPANGGAFYC